MRSADVLAVCLAKTRGPVILASLKPSFTNARSGALRKFRRYGRPTGIHQTESGEEQPLTVWLLGRKQP
jgi:hypothetical protein